MKARMIVAATVAGAVACWGIGVMLGRSSAIAGSLSVSSTLATPTPSATMSAQGASPTVMDAGGPATRPSAAATWVDTRPAGPTSTSVPVVTVTVGAGAPRGEIPAPGEVDRDDPSVVAAAFTQTLLTVDVRIDGSPTVAAVRAGVYATPALAAQLAQAPVGSSGAEWASLLARAGFTVCGTAPASLGERPADTESAAVRGISASVTGFSSDRQQMWVRDHVVLVALTRDGGTWVVSNWQYAN